MTRSALMRRWRPFLEKHSRLKAVLRRADLSLSRLHHSVARVAPQIIRPEPRHLTIAVTAHCNLRCIGCRYGRDFMSGQQLPLNLVRDAIRDARAGGVNTVRFYGGEPLLHPDLPKMVEHAIDLGLYTYITTNGTLLRHKIDALYSAGLRLLTIGFYGIGDKHSRYTQRGGSFKRLEAGLDALRARYGGDIELQLNYVLMAPSCSLEDVRLAWSFAERYDMFFHVDLVNPTVPFFNIGADGSVEITDRMAPAVLDVARKLLALKRQFPNRVLHSVEFLRSIPDWLLRPDKMAVPCDAYQTLWIGADGTVQICDTALAIGNIYKTPLRDLMFSEQHKKAARDGFCLNCPRCLCKIETRIQKDLRSVRYYCRDPVSPVLQKAGQD